jgi:protein-S-isoprenylcysteine O-methyltransferase Ste14
MDEKIEIEVCTGLSSRKGWQGIARRIRVPMGFVFAAFFLWLARPGWRSLAASLALVVPGVWLRGYAAGYVKKNAELTTTGPYAYTRNPLYLGSMLIALGFAAASWNWVILAVLIALFAAIYVPTIQSEESYLRAHFPGFDGYAQNVPRLLPRLIRARIPTPGAHESDIASAGFSRALYLKHREYNAGIGAGAIYLALALKLAFLQRFF